MPNSSKLFENVLCLVRQNLRESHVYMCVCLTCTHLKLCVICFIRKSRKLTGMTSSMKKASVKSLQHIIVEKTGKTDITTSLMLFQF